ncbi:sigma-54-dependent Fis family transcriptional regulator [Sinobaca sp. H24]|uniref:sigma-54 interaction domain-containing protein n=1 Tax=Sinobaca sp. H24 TaxID=2923376 RepID=UPI00207A0629|nr:sigma 54-interacting transcriptional regulator [Sinobaca sp. H24]
MTLSETIYQTLIQHIDLGIHIVDDTGKTVIYNEKMAQIENMNSRDVLYRNIADVFAFNEGHGSTLEQAWRNGTESHKPRQTYLNNQGVEITTVNHTFPVREGGRIIGAVEIAKDITKLERILQENRSQSSRKYTFQHIIGSSRELMEAVEFARRATRTASSVLIIGETGTGKEIFAQSIHNESSRAAKPFISQNCVALPDSLIESILFGTSKGAFTGASDRPGLFEQAEGGTLLLDELNSLSPHLQAKLLRVLQERTIRRIGGTKDVEVDIRIIATMNEDPVEAITENRLRKDLYYRLGVVTLFIPPLQERKDDIAPLAEFFTAKYNRLFQLHVTGLTPAVERLFQEHNWPGNVRELEHVIEGAMNVIETEELIDTKHLPFPFRNRPVPDHTPAISTAKQHDPAVISPIEGSPGLHEYLFQAEKQYVKQILEENNYNIKQAAGILGLSRQSLQYRLKKLGIQKILV